METPPPEHGARESVARKLRDSGSWSVWRLHLYPNQKFRTRGKESARRSHRGWERCCMMLRVRWMTKSMIPKKNVPLMAVSPAPRAVHSNLRSGGCCCCRSGCCKPCHGLGRGGRMLGLQKSVPVGDGRRAPSDVVVGRWLLGSFSSRPVSSRFAEKGEARCCTGPYQEDVRRARPLYDVVNRAVLRATERKGWQSCLLVWRSQNQTARQRSQSTHRA
jgi:hypothetical protein